jgi:hypothetical protein
MLALDVVAPVVPKLIEGFVHRNPRARPKSIVCSEWQ